MLTVAKSVPFRVSAYPASSFSLTMEVCATVFLFLLLCLSD
ncbi:hypothetical protein HMPREF9446_03484 [Bacteroides fluxus YIT 12057]|uniref:Uncharacterized protein n=1 Tax=Bacteroides fluxus YIT 12057 TaxID=763034 RepID=F3PXI6_9BACE|nr:hypothetical protein HMPREF9446_03484 [Bacteroides fluxus YIT 12057]